MRKWRKIYAHDRAFRPPPTATLRLTVRELNPHCLWLEALSRENAFPSSGLDIPVATAAVRPDPLDPSCGSLSLLHFVNDRSTLHVLFENLAEELYPVGIRTLTGPAHLFPFLGSGALSSHWHLPTPPDAPYQPPYAAEHLNALMSPLDTTTLFHFETIQTFKPSDAVVERLEPHRLSTDLLPLLESAAKPYPVTAIEAKAILHWLGPFQPSGLFIAHPNAPETPVGFVLLYGEERQINPLRRNTLRIGRIWGGVREDIRRQGLGRALLQAGLAEARVRGWGSMSIGPVLEASDAARFLRACGGVAQQRYTLYRTSF